MTAVVVMKAWRPAVPDGRCLLRRRLIHVSVHRSDRQ